MWYVSSRNTENKVRASKAILEGIAKDGGLFVCEKLPEISEEEIERLVNLKYSERAIYLLKKFLTDFDESELKKAIINAYCVDNFPCENVAKVKNLNCDVSVLELWHGPTLAFKDVALTLLPHLLKIAAKKEKEIDKVLILTATSGDTGKAALEGFKNVSGVEIFVFYPEDGVSEIQKLSMKTQTGANVHVFGVDGNFDDAQFGIKKIFVDEDLKQMLYRNKIVFSTANSINLGRLVAQIVYYFSAYCDMVKQGIIKFKNKINVVVPTGNFGNVLACFYAKKMGLFVEDVVVASNRNCVLFDFIKTGIYDKNRNFYRTISPSMDILVSSNLERLLFFLYENSEDVKKLYEEFAKTGKFCVSDVVLKKLQFEFFSEFSNDEETKKTILKIFNECGYLCDTHTAVAFNVLDKYLKTRNNGFKNLVVSTASPLKFAPDVLKALGEKSNLNFRSSVERVCKMLNILKPKFFEVIEKNKIFFNKVIGKEEMKDVVLRELNLKYF